MGMGFGVELRGKDTAQDNTSQVLYQFFFADADPP